MRRYARTLFRFFTIALAAVCVVEANLFIPSTTLDLGIGTPLLASDCQDVVAADLEGQIAPDGPWITKQCPEVCGGPLVTRTFLRHWQDPTNNLDWVVVWCGTGREGWIPARSVEPGEPRTCWNCQGGCAGEGKCPPGMACVPYPAKSVGSDCHMWSCRAGYSIRDDASSGIPYCQRTDPCPLDPPVQHCTPASVLLEGPTTIRTGRTCTWSALVFSECTGAGYTYNWYVFNTWVGGGQTYTGGKPNGVLAGQSWKLRVEASYNGGFAGSREITVKESATAPLCTN
jgi:hypothetical protein